MAEMICRLLRDGALDGEYAPALTISDSIHNPFGSYAFNYLLSHLCSNISSSKSQARVLVLIAFDHSPLFYIDLLKSNGLDVAASDKCYNDLLRGWQTSYWCGTPIGGENLCGPTIRILDCYSDPLGWKDKLLGLGIHVNFSKTGATPFKDVGNMEKLFTSIVDIGRGVAGPSKVRFSVAIDSVSAMLRHATLGSVSGLISKLRSHDQVSCMFWLVRSDLHECKASAALEYMSSMVATLEPWTHSSDGHDQNSKGGKFNVRFKRRNGRVKVTSEEFHMEQSGIKFLSVSSEKLMVNQNLIPKVQFNLHLSEKERVDKAKVVLPFEHQGNGETIQIYDGRQSLSEGQTDPHSKRPGSTNKLTTETPGSKGEIHYIRDSDDERPDSDEDPDDDLDI